MLKGTPVYGFGVNDADYQVNVTESLNGKRVTTWRCAYYQKWVNMLDRAYGRTFRPSYVGVKVCDEWRSFMAFKSWMEKQDWEGKELDKDLLGGGTLYSPDTCCFISKRANMILQSGSLRFNGSYWVTSVRLPDGSRRKIQVKDKSKCAKLATDLKIKSVYLLTEEDCADSVREALAARVSTYFYEEGL
jgi:hypothetical protein